MTEDKIEPREINWRQLLPWTVLFRSFGVAMGFSKLCLAAAGILVMAVGWWLLAFVFYAGFAKPDPSNFSDKDYPGDNETERRENAFKAFRDYRNAWNLLHETAGPANSQEVFDAADLADSRAEYEEIKQLVAKAE